MGKIEHIFNAIDRKKENNISISHQPFEIDYIESIIDNKESTLSIKEIETESDKLYYEALKSSENSIISKYDDEKISKLIENFDDRVLIISGDFWGIQKFIFTDISSKKVSKILRSRSAMIQLITYAITDIIKNKFQNSDIVLFGAGKFMILANYEEEYQTKLDSISKELDKFFIKNFFGQNGFVISTQITTKERLLNQNSEEMKSDLIYLGKQNEINKLNKFDFENLEEFSIDIFKEAKKDDEICEFCKKRVATEYAEGEKACEVCANQINLGAFLTKKEFIKIYKSKEANSKKDIKILDFGETKFWAKFYKEEQDVYDCNIEGDVFDISNKKYRKISKWPLSSFVAKDENRIKSFEELSKNSNGLMALKADVDKLGDTFRDFYMTSFKKFNRLSRELDFFFSNYVPYWIENSDYENLYIIFAGGDDLFLIGEYKEIVKFAKELREKFYKFALKKATLSMGLVMFKHSTPINFISNLADEAESRAKEVKYKNQTQTRDGIDIFGISMKFDEFNDIDKKWNHINTELVEKGLDSTTFYYRLIELSQMRENLEKQFNVVDSMWKSKLSYIYKRNLSKLNEKSYNQLIELIDKYGIKLQPFIFLTIYKNRDKEKK